MELCLPFGEVSQVSSSSHLIPSFAWIWLDRRELVVGSLAEMINMFRDIRLPSLGAC
jgi:hypothetical protein